jgi:hypothetical protein
VASSSDPIAQVLEDKSGKEITTEPVRVCKDGLQAFKYPQGTRILHDESKQFVRPKGSTTGKHPCPRLRYKGLPYDMEVISANFPVSKVSNQEYQR